METTSNHALCPAYIIPALQTLVSRHDALRATVSPGDDSTNHVPLFVTNTQFENIETSTVKDFGRCPMKRAVEAIRMEFDLSSQLFRFSFLQSGPNNLSLVLSFHHIAADGASIQTLLYELLSLLAGRSLPPNPPQITTSLPRLGDSPGQSSDETKRERIKRKWMSIMGSTTKCSRINLPERETETMCTKSSEWVAIKCPSSVTDMVDEIASFYKVSPTVVLTAMFSIAVREELLSSEEVVVIGCASENRRRSQRDMVGHTVNLLPLKLDFPAKDTPITLSTIVSQMKTGWSLIMEGGVTLIDLLPVLPCLRSRDSQLISNQDRVYSASPLQIIFSFLPTPQKSLPKSVALGEGNEVLCRVDFPRSCDAQADLFLEVRAPGNWEGNEAETSYLFTWEFRSAALNRARIEKLHNFTLDVLTSCSQNITSGRGNDVIEFAGNTENPRVAENMIVSSYSFQGEETEETDSTYNTENETVFLRGARGIWLWPHPPPTDPELLQDSAPFSPSSYNPPKPLQLPLKVSLVEGVAMNAAPTNLAPIQMILETASRVPDNLAFRYGTETLTYAQAIESIERLAKVLRWKGVTPGNHVGLVMPPCTNLYISLLAILRCGAAYVPLSLHHPQSTLLAMLETADSKLLLTDTATLTRKLPDYNGDYVRVDCDIVTEDVPPLAEDLQYHRDLVAFIIFTSGTTGVPKGVAITNESLSQFLANFRLVATPHDTRVTLAGCTVAWDGHVLDSLGPLLNGSCLVIAPTLEISEGITFAFMSPSAASVLRFPRSLRCLMVGGEAFTRTCYESIKRIPKVVSVYGPTETTVFVSVMYMDPSSDSSKSFSNLGMAMPGVSLMVCDSRQRPVALGNEGELCIAGRQVSRAGYHNNSVKTRQSFVQSPLPGYGIVYRTGDLTRMLLDGTIVFLGRTDDQVKLRGMRFQLHEVENALRRHSGVKMAAVAVRNQGTPSAQLLGFVTPREIELDALYDFLRGHLPTYMIPSSITTLDELPLKNEGKVDRKALLRMTQQTRETGETDTKKEEVANRESSDSNEVAERLARVFGQVLGVDSYPVTADFFTSGGQSLLLFRLLQVVNGELSCQLSLSHLLQSFQNLSPLSLAAIIQGTRLESSDETQRLSGNEASKSQRNGGTTKDKGAAAMEVGAATSTARGDESTKSSTSGKGSIMDSDRDSATIASKTGEKSPRDGAMAVEKDSSSSTTTVESIAEFDSTTNRGETEETGMTSEDDTLARFDYLEPVPKPAKLEFLDQLLHGGGSKLSTGGKCDLLQKETGIHIPPSSLEKYSDTTALLTQLKLKRLIDYFDGASSPVVQLGSPTTGEHDQPIIFLHGGIIGWPLPYLSLARSLPGSSFAIQRCEESPTESFEDMVAYYVKSILETQPNGPYRLVGVCYGAVMVYEVARQLTDKGHTVKLAVFVNHSPAIEKKPAIFDSQGEPLAGTFVDPIVFFRKVLGLPLEGVEEGGREEGRKANKRLEQRVKKVVSTILSSPESSWIPFTAAELERIYLGFFNRLRCAWRGYTPRPGAAITHCLLLRNPTHPLFHSHDFGLGSLLPSGARLTVSVAPQTMGLMSDPATHEFVTTQIESCLTPNSPTTHSVKGLE